MTQIDESSFPTANGPELDADPSDGRHVIDLTGPVAREILDIRVDPNKPFISRDELPVPRSVSGRFDQLYEDVPQLREALTMLGDFDPGLARHVVQVSLIAGYLAEQAGVSEEYTNLLMVGAGMHDIGKPPIEQGLTTESNVFDKTGKDAKNPLWVRMQKHSLEGFMLATEMFKDEPEDSIYRKIVPLLILVHHCYDEAKPGYPSADEIQELANAGLLNTEDLEDPQLIQIAQILAVSDVYEAITARRAYQKDKGFEDPAIIRRELTRSHGQNMPTQIDQLMDFHISQRFAPDGWMPPSEEQSQKQPIQAGV